MELTHSEACTGETLVQLEEGPCPQELERTVGPLPEANDVCVAALDFDEGGDGAMVLLGGTEVAVGVHVLVHDEACVLEQRPQVE